MDDYFMTRRHVPAFGSWDSGDYLPFTECFESARQAGLRYTSQEEEYADDDSGDLYVTGDLYQNDVVTPAAILVPHTRSKSRPRAAADAKQAKLQSGWEAGDQRRIEPTLVRAVKPVDEDLYRISPEPLYTNIKKKRGLGFLGSCCLVPTCFM